MASLFGGDIPKPKKDKEAEKAQRRQAQEINQQKAEEEREIGARRRLLNARRSGGSNLFSKAGPRGSVKETMGG